MLQRRRLRNPGVALPPVRRRRALRHARMRVSALRSGGKAVGILSRRRGRGPSPAASCAVVGLGPASVGSGLGGVLGLGAAAAVRAPAAAEDAEEQCAAHAGSDADDQGQVLVDPGLDFCADVAVAAALWCVSAC
jgi:hypothetical protein